MRTLPLSRVAQLLAVSRGHLQHLMREGLLRSQDGMVDIDDLQRLFPQFDPVASGALEHVEQIKRNAFGRRVREYVLPSQEVLAQRAVALEEELAGLRRTVAGYEQLVTTLDRGLQRLAADPGSRALRQQLQQGLAAVGGADRAAASFSCRDGILGFMASQVTLHPSGHQFVVEGNDTILESGLRAGLALNYGCGNGSCGLCRARLVSGEPLRIRHSDYPMSAAERSQGYLLTCCHTAAGDLIIETIEGTGASDIPEQQLVARIKALRPLGSDVLELHLQFPRSSRLRFLAGQQAALGIAAPGGDLQGRYPIASCPCDERNLRFHLARDAADPFAQYAFGGAMRVNAEVGVRGPYGDFVLGDPPSPDLVFIAHDTGFAPVRGMIEQALALDVPQLTLAWLATRASGHYAENLVLAWQDAFEQFRYFEAVDPDPAPGAARLLAPLLAEAWRQSSEYFIAGSDEFADYAKTELAGAGVAVDRVHIFRR